MSCFIVPLAQAIVTTACRKRLQNNAQSVFASKLPTLEKMLWGASIALVIDHIASGELTWSFPFFTALGQYGGAEMMLHEMLTVGVPMSLAITAVWAGAVTFSLLREKRSLRLNS